MNVQIQNVGFYDVTGRVVEKAISKETLFIHGSSSGGGSVANNALISSVPEAAYISTNCTNACGPGIAGTFEAGLSSFCDSSCSSKWSAAGPRFAGHNCGAGDASKFGGSCRLCYTNRHEALAMDRELATSGLHVVMCDTEDPPQALDCSGDCQSASDAVSVLFA